MTAGAFAVYLVVSGQGGGEATTGGNVAVQTPMAAGEQTEVPDACTTLPAATADKLAPHADRTTADNYQASDRQNQCVWGAYTGSRKRVLAVELRAVDAAGAATATQTATKAFESERAADESGKSLLGGQTFKDKKRVDGLGEENYIVYSQDGGDGSGTAVANVRAGNVLVTVRYTGGDGGKPLGADQAMGGAQEAARAMLGELGLR